MQTKPKPCKAIGKALGFNSCGKITPFRKFGLCMSCYPKFIMETEAGKLIMQKAILKVQKPRLEETKSNNKKLRIEIMSNDEYRKTYIQPVINKIARLIDFGQPCIATKRYGKMAGGHFYSVGSNRTTALNLHNIHIQNFESNGMSGGDPLLYIDGLKDTYGNDYFDFVTSLKKTPILKLKKSEMIEIYSRAKIIVLKLQKDLKELTPTERINARNEFNTFLNIYEEDYCIFKY